MGGRSVTKLNADGNLITKWGTGIGNRWAPHGVTVASDGYVYIVDIANNCIQKFTSSGKFIAHWETKGSGALSSWSETAGRSDQAASLLNRQR